MTILTYFVASLICFVALMKTPRHVYAVRQKVTKTVYVNSNVTTSSVLSLRQRVIAYLNAYSVIKR